MANRRVVKLWLFVWALLTYIVHNKAFGLCLYSTGLFCGRARNVGMWLPAKLWGEENALHLEDNSSLHVCIFYPALYAIWSGCFSRLPAAAFSLLHLPFSHSQPGWLCWVYALQASQDVAIERASVGKARARLYVHNSKPVSVHRLRIPQCLS